MLRSHGGICATYHLSGLWNLLHYSQLVTLSANVMQGYQRYISQVVCGVEAWKFKWRQNWFDPGGPEARNGGGTTGDSGGNTTREGDLVDENSIGVSPVARNSLVINFGNDTEFTDSVQSSQISDLKKGEGSKDFGKKSEMGAKNAEVDNERILQILKSQIGAESGNELERGGSEEKLLGSKKKSNEITTLHDQHSTPNPAGPLDQAVHDVLNTVPAKISSEMNHRLIRPFSACEKDNSMGCGVVVREGNGTVLAAMSKKIPLIREAEHAEAVAAYEAAKFGLDCGFWFAQIEGDASSIIQGLTSSEENLSNIGCIIEDTRNLVHCYDLYIFIG
ncbi:hypothetical protein RJ639_027756 [Escallonia herrerae]|uniref:RNase H type-1 domain-containing protein n=1 Tax=Escallonia herrerae TaxID=1293975 RepID=A0AA88X4S6_9ASTE|nr:hypothetical protein RJ639_027756 [Escallonia herrerae]